MSVPDMRASAARHQDVSILFAVRQGEQAKIPDAARVVNYKASVLPIYRAICVL
jgi:hypothetical protein